MGEGLGKGSCCLLWISSFACYYVRGRLGNVVFPNEGLLQGTIHFSPFSEDLVIICILFQTLQTTFPGHRVLPATLGWRSATI